MLIKTGTGHTVKDKQSLLNPLFQATVKPNPHGVPDWPCMHVDMQHFYSTGAFFQAHCS